MPKPVCHFFSGKGGVGKTTLACAAALASARKGKRTLLISTDPAHSIADSFEKPIGSKVLEVTKNLWACEIDPAEAVAEYKAKLMPRLEGPLAAFGDTLDLAGMTPGIDELAAFDKFLHYLRSSDYDVIVFDTAPTGHTLRFLSLPDVMDSWIGKLLAMRAKFEGIANLAKKFLPFGSAEQKGPSPMEQLEKMKQRIAEGRKALADAKRTRYHLVLIPEEMSILESHRSLSILKKYKIALGPLVVNQLIPANPHCRFCAQRRQIQQERLKQIRAKFKGLKVLEVPQYPREVHGEKDLLKIAQHLKL